MQLFARSDDAQRTRPRRGRGALPLAVIVAAFALLGASACAPTPPDAKGTDPSAAPRAGEAAYTAAGPHAVGVTTMTVDDRKIEVWYPADAAAAASTPRDSYRIRTFVPTWLTALLPADLDPVYVTNAHRDVAADRSAAPYPLVLFSHGLASFRLQSTEITTHLASWGFVVVSAEYLDRGLQAILGEPPAVSKPDSVVADEAIRAVRAANDASTGPLAGPLVGMVRPNEVHPIGHSAGGATSLALLDRPDVHDAIAISMGMVPLVSDLGLFHPPADKSVMYIGGAQDKVLPVDWLRSAYAHTPGQKKLMEMSVAGHINGFTDLCDVGEGGISGLARSAGLPIPSFLLDLGDDGCPHPPNTPNSILAPQVEHLLTAELRYRSGLDPEPVGLGDQVRSQLPNLTAYHHAP